jgi:hypothetical protein
MYIMAAEPISTAYFINPSVQSVCLYAYLPVVDRQRLGENVGAETNTEQQKDYWMGPSICRLCRVKGK